MIAVPPNALPSLSAGCTAAFEDCRAGISPNKAVVSTIIAIEKRATRQSKPSSMPTGPTGVESARSAIARPTTAAIPKPTAEPSPESRRLSVRSWRTMRPRPAPIAKRTAISRRRVVQRASSRFAMLTHAISRTIITSARRRPANSDTVPPISGSSRAAGYTVTMAGPLASPEVFPRLAASVERSACACSIETSGRRRPIM